MKRSFSACRRDWQLWLAIVFAAGLLLAGAFPIAGAVRYHLRCQALVAALSESTVYAYEAESLTVEQEGTVRAIGGSCGYQIYRLIAGTTPGRWREAPEEAAAIIFRYGDGGCLELWQVTLQGSAGTGLYYRFTSPEGERYGFDSALLTLAGIQRLLAQEAAKTAG